METLAENLIGGSDALRLLGLQHKPGSAAAILKEVGIEPVYVKKASKGTIIFLKRDDVLRVKEEMDSQKQTSRDEKTEEAFVWTQQDIKFLIDKLASLVRQQNQIEEKINRLLAIWQIETEK